MWASIEKWAYPQWSFPLITDNPAMTFGFDPEFFMQAAGVVEFTLAFALIWTPLVRRVASIILAATFVSAIFQFGKIDAIGHALIIVVLVAIAADNVSGTEKRWNTLLAPVAYCLALTTFLTALLPVTRGDLRLSDHMSTWALHFTCTRSFIFG